MMQDSISGMTRSCFEEVQTKWCEDVFRKMNMKRLSLIVTLHHMEATLVQQKHLKRCYNAVFIGQVYLKIVLPL